MTLAVQLATEQAPLAVGGVGALLPMHPCAGRPLLGALAAARMDNLSPADIVSGNQLRHLDALFTHIDRRIAAITRAGASDRSYLLRVTIPRIDLSSCFIDQKSEIGFAR